MTFILTPSKPPYYENAPQPSPAGYPSGTKIFEALATQVGTSAQTNVELQNSIGAIVWTRFSAGIYKGTLAGAFPANKTVPTMGAIAGVLKPSWQIYRESDNVIVIGTLVNEVYTDGELNNTPIQIVVYP